MHHVYCVEGTRIPEMVFLHEINQWTFSYDSEMISPKNTATTTVIEARNGSAGQPNIT